MDDLILSAAVAPSTGYTTKILNGGSMRNTGTEYSLSMTPIDGREFTWVSRTTFANVWSRVTHLDVPCFLGGSFFSQRFGAPYVCTGYSVTTLQAFNGWDSTFSGGTFVSRTRHISNWDSAPKYTMGFSNDFTWKNFSLSSLFDYRRGGYAVDLTGLYVDPVEILQDTMMTNTRFGNYLKGYAAYVEPAGFVKLRELSLTYTVPRSVVALAHRRRRSHAAAATERPQPGDVDQVQGLRPGSLELQQPEHRPLPGRDALSAQSKRVLLGDRQLLT